MEQVNRCSCLGVRSKREIEPVEQESEPDQSKPLIVIPVYGPIDRYYWRQKKHGFYDVVLEWYLRGKVRIRFGDKGYFWWGEEGEVLLMERDLVIDLHDRKVDPPRWEGEVPYKHAFFFNQYHLENGRNHKATYFTYAPIHLEETRKRLGRVSWDQRRHASIFAGSIENETQDFFRNRFKGWEDAIEIYSCSDRLRKKESHKYGVNEYLDLVAHSRFGVSFRGNGPKCFRELEYLALGTPLIITPGVEVDYPSPIQEGVHFFRAESKDDIPRLIYKVTEDQWESMSRACWEWFDQHGTIDQMHAELTAKIHRLDLQANRHKCVMITAPKEKAESSLAARSLKIIDPNAIWIAEDEVGEATLRIDPESLVINELPIKSLHDNYTWHIPPAMHREYCGTILNSDLEIHKGLLGLFGLRLRNFRIHVFGSAGEIPLWDRRTEKGLELRDDKEKASLHIDFDWSRRCSQTYEDRTRRIEGPGLITFPTIIATLFYRRHGQPSLASLSNHFNDYYAIHGELIPEDKVIKVCNLCNFQDASFDKVDIIAAPLCQES